MTDKSEASSKLLLSDVTKLIEQQEKEARENNESHNIFSALKLETKEIAHSNFIADLLSPEGKHEKGHLFLEAFLQRLDEIAGKKSEYRKLDSKSIKVKTEYKFCALDLKKEEGGIIDIFLWDKTGQSICIENKIYAVDQPAQLIRYRKHNERKNIVFYLTPMGKEPEKTSIQSQIEKVKEGEKKRLMSGIDYHLLSYKHNIIPWLEEDCMPVCKKTSTLYQNIRQYIILVKKITYQSMEDKELQELRKLILSKWDAAKEISFQFSCMKREIGNEIRTAVNAKFLNDTKLLAKSKIEIEWGDEFNSKSKKLQLYIKMKKDDYTLKFSIESFAGEITDGELPSVLFIGLLQEDYQTPKWNVPNPQKLNDYFPHHKVIEWENGEPIDFTKLDCLQSILESDANRNNLVECIVNQTIEFIQNFNENSRKSS